MPATQTPLDRKQFPDTAGFLDWHQSQKAQGLVDVKFFPASTENATVETFCAEFNKARSAEALNDPEFF